MAAPFDEYDYLERQLEGSRGHGKRDDRGSSRDMADRDKRHRSRHGSRSPSRGSRRRSRSRSRDKRSRRHGSPRREKERREEKRERTPPEVRLLREKERELKELERTTRTVFASNLNIKADEKDLFEFFSKAGTVADIKLIMDKNTRRSKGIAYVEFERQEDVFNSLALSGQMLMGQVVMVKASEAEKNLAWEAQQQAKQNQLQATNLLGAALGAAGGPCRLQISNLHPELKEPDLKTLFEPFGPIQMVQVVRDAAGNSVGYGYITYANFEAGTKALQHWNGRPLADMPLKVQLATITPSEGGPTTTIGELDEDEENFKLNTQNRIALMNRLASSAGLQTQAPTTVVPPNATAAMQNAQSNIPVILEQGLLGPASPIPTPCLLLKNMFTAEEQKGDAWDEEIAEDVRDECKKFGPVAHVFVDPNSKGFVYIKFGSVEGAQAAHRALHGRWYSGHQIVAEYQFTQVYNNFFKL